MTPSALCDTTRSIALALCLALGAAGTWAGSYPDKPITVVVPFSAGSGTDQIARGMARTMPEFMPGATVVIDNKPGASGIIAAQYVARAPADGYTLLMTTNTTQTANPYLFKKLNYDPVGDFAPVGALAKGAMVMVVPASSSLKTVAEFITYAHSKPVSFGAGNSSSRVAGEQFKQMAGVEMTYVPYTGNPQAVNDLIGGQLDVMFADTATSLPLIQAGRLRALAYTGVQRTPTLPAVPTLIEAGLKGYELSYWVAVYAPKGTPKDIVDRLNAIFAKSLKTETMKSIYAHSVIDVFSSSPEGLADFQRRESARWGAVIKAAAIQPE